MMTLEEFDQFVSEPHNGRPPTACIRLERARRFYKVQLGKDAPATYSIAMLRHFSCIDTRTGDLEADREKTATKKPAAKKPAAKKPAKKATKPAKKAAKPTKKAKK